MNIAKRCLSHYESKDFKNNYLEVLSETYHDNENEIIKRIENLFNISNYETEKYLSNHRFISKQDAKKIYDVINDNFEDFVSKFSGYYVGYTSLESVFFGEQEEQLEGIYNHKTGSEYSLPYLKKIFDKEGFVINRNSAYYVVSGGLHVDLLGNVELINSILK
jgi:hypothetical protein